MHPSMRWSMGQVAEAVASAQVSARDVVEAALARVQETEPSVHAFSEVFDEEALYTADEIDRRRDKGERLGPLAGVPVAVKEMFDVAGRSTTAGSRAFDRVASYDAEAAQRLRAAGAVLIGRTVAHELGFAANVPDTRNAWDPTRAPGGSSAGSAVAVAVGSVHAALGTDTGGSVRVPASLNGVVGMKPTLGLVDTHGTVAMSPSLDTVGCITRTVRDTALLLRVLARERWREPARATTPLTAVRVGRVDHTHASTEVAHAVDAALVRLADEVDTLDSITLPHRGLYAAVGTVMVLSDTARSLRADLGRIARDLHPGTLTTLVAGLALPRSSRDLAERLCVRARAEIDALFERNGVDVLAIPGFPFTPGPPNDLAQDQGEGAMQNALDQQMVANLAGLPAITVPCGSTPDGLPVGLQLIARRHCEELLLRVAETVELQSEWPRRVAQASTQEGAD